MKLRDLNRYDNLRNPESFRDNEIPNADLWLSYPNAGEEFIGMKKDENDGAMMPGSQKKQRYAREKKARVRGVRNTGIQRVAHGLTQQVCLVPHV